MKKSTRIILLSILLSIAIVLGYLESLIPSIPIPGVKLGLANIIILLSIKNFRIYESLLILLLRIVIVSLLLGTFLNVSFFMSLSGGVLSYIAMFLLTLLQRRFKKINTIFISISGAIFHSIGQIIIAIIIIDSSKAFYYLPFILLLSIPTGIITGIIVSKLNTMEIFSNLREKEE